MFQMKSNKYSQHCTYRYLFPRFFQLYHCFQKFVLTGPAWLQNITMDPHITAYVNIVSGR